MNKKIVLVIVCVLLAVIAVVLIDFDIAILYKKETPTPISGDAIVQNQEEMVEENELKKAIAVEGNDDLKANGIVIEEKDTGANIRTTIQNNGQDNIEENMLILVIRDKEGNIILKSAINVKNLPVSGERNIQIATDKDLSEAYSYTIEKE